MESAIVCTLPTQIVLSVKVKKILLYVTSSEVAQGIANNRVRQRSYVNKKTTQSD